MTDKTIPEICADLLLKRDKYTKFAELSPTTGAWQWARYSNYCADAVPLLVEEIRRLLALLAKVQHHDCESIQCRHCGFHRELHWGISKCLGGKTEFTPKDCTCYLSEKEPTPQAQEWQPMAKAPKTGKPILVYCPRNQNTLCVKWDKNLDGWVLVGSGGRCSLGNSPTHWQFQLDPPLPTAEPVVRTGKIDKEVKLTEAQHREQCISFAYGNTHFSNLSITRKMVEEMYDKWHPRDSGTPADASPRVSDTNKLDGK